MVGIDPHLELLPEPFAIARNARAPLAERAAAVEAFGCELVELVADRVAVVKPQAAFFEVLGSDGLRAFESVVAHARSHGLLVIGDLKRGDIASTAAAYADAYLGPRKTQCDAMTVNAFLGADTLEPFVARCRETDAGLFVLVRTSNPGSGAVQLHGEPQLWTTLARAVEDYGGELRGESGFSSIGAVVGATHPDELARVRAAMPNTPFLLPGYGAQGAGAADIVAAFPDRSRPWRGGVVNSSRQIAFAWRGAPELDWKDASSRALDAMIADLREALEGAPA